MIRGWISACAVMATACSSAPEPAVDCLGRRMTAAELDGSAQLRWTAPAARSDGSPLADLAGYRVYYGIAPDALSCRIEIGDPQAVEWTVTGLSPGTWHFAVVSIDSARVESKPSMLVSKQID